MIQDDTISAISTAVGEAGIGIVRMSGNRAIELADKIFKAMNGKKIESQDDRKIIYGKILDRYGEIIDEAVVLVMRAPNSYTKEDVVELQCHGSVAALKKVLLRTLEVGARLAERGEFTKRAFLNGRLDLSQAQAVLDIIQSKTDAALKISEDKLSGKMSNVIYEVKQRILNVIAHIEAMIDFPEDGIDNVVLNDIDHEVMLAIDIMNELLKNETTGKILKEGIPTAIIGKPNVGKSSLLNFLSNTDKAIVTEIPGTTRDTIEEYISIEGIPLKIIDTAGIHNSNDKIEQIGIEKSKTCAEEASLILALFDGSRRFDDEDEYILKFISNRNVIILITKFDLPQMIDVNFLRNSYNLTTEMINVSVKNKTGIENLYNSIRQKIYSFSSELDFIKNAREIEKLQQVKICLNEAKKSIKMNMEIDLISIDLRSALHALDELTGEVVDEDIINEIFSKFCIGK